MIRGHSASRPSAISSSAKRPDPPPLGLGQKYRRKVLVTGVDAHLEVIIADVCSERDARIIEMEVMPDHVHLIVDCDPQSGIHRPVRLIKGRSSPRLTR
jgi:REP element-mobilizing transposase RayT